MTTGVFMAIPWIGTRDRNTIALAFWIKNMVGVRVGIAQSVTEVSQTCPDSMDFGFSSGLTRRFEAMW